MKFEHDMPKERRLTTGDIQILVGKKASMILKDKYRMSYKDLYDSMMKDVDMEDQPLMSRVGRVAGDFLREKYDSGRYGFKNGDYYMNRFYLFRKFSRGIKTYLNIMGQKFSPDEQSN